MRRVGFENPEITMAKMVIAVILCFLACSSMVSGFSTTTRRKLGDVEEQEEQFRRNLLANGLGKTPPMG